MFSKILVPIIHGSDSNSLVAMADAISGDSLIVLVGLVPSLDSKSLSSSALHSKQLRKTLRKLRIEHGSFRVRERVRVSLNPWKELTQLIQEERPDLLLLEWPGQFEALRTTPAEVFAQPPCNVAVFSGSVPTQVRNILVPIRGGPFAELALRLSLSTVQGTQASLTSLHITPKSNQAGQDISFRAIEDILKHLPEINRENIIADDPAALITSMSSQFDLVVMGATAQSVYKVGSIGLVADQILRDDNVGVIVVKTRATRQISFDAPEVSQTAVSVLVDKWFAQNTHDANEYEELGYLVDLKHKQKLTVSLALPALNEEKSVGNVLKILTQSLMERFPLLDEIILVDSNSTDRTRDIAKSLHVPVHIHQATLPQYGARDGKGEALWKSLFLTTGDIILWIDTDIANIHPRFVYGLLGPMLVNPKIQFTKGFYRRPIKVGNTIQAGGGGRVTELTARPLLNLFYPELSGVVQPLSGEYGGRRAALEQVNFSSGYGVEIGLLIDVLEKWGLDSIAQVDLLERIHHNQPLEALSKMSFAIIQTVIRKLEGRYGRSILDEVNQTMKLIRYQDDRYHLDVEDVVERERPPMIGLPEYQLKFKK